MSMRTRYGYLAWQVVQLVVGLVSFLFLCAVAAYCGGARW